MSRNFLLLIAVLTVAATSCNNKKQSPDKEAHTDKKEAKKTTKHSTWSYEGETSPEHWAKLEGDAACGGNHQSPINIIESDAVVKASGLKESDLHYVEQTLIDNIVNNGHSIQYNFKGTDNYVNFKGKRYNLAQFHFHSPSEHTINGIRYPLVMHMVHQSTDKDFVVFAVMISEGKRSEMFNFLESYLPIQPGESKKVGVAHDLTHGADYSFEHFYYQGSLTTPPCTESVHWFVFKNPLTASVEQVKALAALMPKNNYRTEQPVNGREITLNK